MMSVKEYGSGEGGLKEGVAAIRGGVCLGEN
jgi:hypothetical protein